MPVYEIEQYELHATKYLVDADDEAQAIAKLFDGKAELVEGSQELIDVADDYGLPVDEFPELAKALQRRGVAVDEDTIPSIRSIEKIEP